MFKVAGNKGGTRGNAQLERRINLTFAFLQAAKSGSSALTVAWIARNIPGYKDLDPSSPEELRALEKRFERDRAALIRAGVPIESVAVGGSVGYRLPIDQYELPEVEFTPEEASVLALAGNMGLGSELASFTRSGWTKIAATGVERELRGGPQLIAVNDWDTLSVDLIDTVVKACLEHRRIGFSYTKSSSFEPITRWMDPWKLVGLRDAVYLVGYDVDREAPRVFRSRRIADVEILDMSDPEVAGYGPFHYPAPDTDFQKMVETQLRIGHNVVDVTLTVDDGFAPEITNRSVPLGGGRYRLEAIEKDWIVRHTLTHVPHVRVESPKEVIEEITARLRKVAE